MSINQVEFKHIFDQYFESIKSFVYFKIGDIAAAEDVVQETFIKLWERRFEIKKETVLSLIYTIASNLAKNYIKHQNVVYSFANRQKTEHLSETPLQILEKKEFAQKLETALGSLTEAHRTTFLMNRIDQLTYAQIAKRLEISVKTVEKRMSVSLKQLYKLLGYKL